MEFAVCDRQIAIQVISTILCRRLRGSTSSPPPLPRAYPPHLAQIQRKLGPRLRAWARLFRPSGWEDGGFREFGECRPDERRMGIMGEFPRGVSFFLDAFLLLRDLCRRLGAPCILRSAYPGLNHPSKPNPGLPGAPVRAWARLFRPSGREDGRFREFGECRPAERRMGIMGEFPGELSVFLNPSLLVCPTEAEWAHPKISVKRRRRETA